MVQRQPLALSAASDRLVQRQDNDEEKDPATEGLKLTVEKALEKPEVKKGLENLWDSIPTDGQVGLMSIGGVTLGLAYLSLILSPKMRENLSDVDIGKPLSLVPYVPIESFKYKLPTPGKPLTLSGELGFEDYFELLRKSHPGLPITNLTIGLEGALAPGSGFSVTGGKLGLELFGGGLSAEAKTFDKITPYPLLVPGAGLGPPTTLMQSYPELPPLYSGPGAQITVTADLVKLFPGVFGGTPLF